MFTLLRVIFYSFVAFRYFMYMPEEAAPVFLAFLLASIVLMKFARWMDAKAEIDLSAPVDMSLLHKNDLEVTVRRVENY